MSKQASERERKKLPSARTSLHKSLLCCSTAGSSVLIEFEYFRSVPSSGAKPEIKNQISRRQRQKVPFRGFFLGKRHETRASVHLRRFTFFAADCDLTKNSRSTPTSFQDVHARDHLTLPRLPPCGARVLLLSCCSCVRNGNYKL
jgi:hypothetical protein